MSYIIIVAGGKGLRMGTDVPKQFIPIGGKPVLMHTIERFQAYDKRLKIILVLPREQHPYWQKLCKEYGFGIPHTVVDGGETRFESSKNGLKAIPADAEGLVGIHDGVRPFVSGTVIARCFKAASESDTAIPVLSVTETLRYVDNCGVAKNVLRSNYRTVQTPQVFDIGLLRRAFNQPYQDSFTDEASVVENLGYTVTMVEGNQENIKLTTPFDLTIAEAMLKS